MTIVEDTHNRLNGSTPARGIKHQNIPVPFGNEDDDKENIYSPMLFSCSYFPPASGIPLGSGVSLPLRPVWTAFPIPNPGNADSQNWPRLPRVTKLLGNKAPLQQLPNSNQHLHQTSFAFPSCVVFRNKNWGNIPWRVTATIITEDKVVSSGSFPWDVFNSIYFGYFHESLTSLNPTILFIFVRNNTIIQKGLSCIHLCEKLGHLSDQKGS